MIDSFAFHSTCMYDVVNFLTAVSMPVQSVSPTGRPDATALTHPTTRIQAPTTTKPGKGQSCEILPPGCPVFLVFPSFS